MSKEELYDFVRAFGRRPCSPTIRHTTPSGYERSRAPTLQDLSRSSLAHNATSTDTRMQCIKFSCSAASRRSSNGRKTCNGRNMRWCRPSYMPSQEHIDGASPHKDVALHHEPCTSHLRSTLAKNESRRSPISVGHRKFTVQHELTGQCFGPALRQRHRHALVLRQTPAWCQRAWPDER